MKNSKVTFPLSRKIAVMVIAIAIILSTVLIAAFTEHYRQEMIDDFERMAMDVAAIAATQLNPDKFQTYLDTGVKDEEYEKAFEQLSKFRESADVEYLYVVVPKPDEVWYVMDTDPTEGQIPLGFHQPYYEGEFAANAERMVRGERIKPIVSNEEYGWLLSAYYPVQTSSGDPAGYVGVDILMRNVRENLNNFVFNVIALIALLTAVLSFALIRMTNRTVAEPIRSLSTAARQLVEAERSGGQRELSIFRQLQVDSSDEVGDLYQSLKRMEQDMNAYIRDLVSVTAEKERFGIELSLATRIQADMLPNIFPPFPERKDFDIYAMMTPAKEVGGDFYDFFMLDDNRLALVMADVSDKGIGSALFMAVSKAMLKMRSQAGGSPGEVLSDVNIRLAQDNKLNMFVTVWLGYLDLTTGHLVACNGGHGYPALLLKEKEPGEPEGYVIKKTNHGPMVGIFEGSKYPETEFTMQPGDRLFLYTDGVNEAEKSDGEQFGFDRLLEVLNGNLNGSSETVCRYVKDAVRAFEGEGQQFDDITMLALTFRGYDEKH
jgi:sigma-B regulation protein RsbU (phosphoserine phosphatase)